MLVLEEDPGYGGHHESGYSHPLLIGLQPLEDKTAVCILMFLAPSGFLAQSGSL